MIYFEYSTEMDKLELRFNIAISNIINDSIYQESVSSFFNKLTNTFLSYIDDVKELHTLYKEKKNINKGIKYIENLCNNKSIGNQTIFVRGYNGKVLAPLSLDDDIQTIKNLIAYSKIKIKDPLISEYLKRYELYKSGWDTFYKVKIKEIPTMYNEINEKLDSAITELKTGLLHLSNYFETAGDQKQHNSLIDIFKNIIEKIKTSIKKDINIITMNFEAIQYEIGKKFSKLTETTSNKIVKKDIPDDMIIKNSTFIKEIKYGDDIYKIYQTKYKNVSAMNYGGSFIYVENNFFDLPKGYQLAIIYHEIGHEQCKHFKPDNYKAHTINKNIDIDMDDTDKLVKQIKKDLNKFLHHLILSPYYNEERYLNGEEFIYLLVEWEADRFSSNIVGRKLVKKALTSHFSDSLLSNPLYKDPKKQKIHYKYNMDRMKLRTKNI